jgi:Superfamily II DNA/RNA helicases, SNF2 family
MKALIVSLESFQKGDIPEQVKEYLASLNEEPFIILDESSKIKTNNPCRERAKSKRTQAILKLNKTGERCILTGTFMSKSPLNAYDQMNFLKDGFFEESMYAFAEHYRIEQTLPNKRNVRIQITDKIYRRVYRTLKTAMSKGIDSYDASKRGLYTYFGISDDACDWILNHEEYTPFMHIDDLWRRIGDVCLKVEREDLLDLPPKVYKTIPIVLTAEQRKLYLQLQNQYCTDKIAVDNGLKLYLRFQDVCNGYDPEQLEDTVDDSGVVHHHVRLNPLKENPKLDALEEVIDDIGDKQVVVWCSRTVLLYQAKERIEKMGKTVGVYDGKNEDREKDYNGFADRKIQVLFANQASGGYGLDKLKEADYAVYLCNSYSVEQRQQSEDRIYRGQVQRSKYIIDITCTGTCEDRVARALRQGKELLDTGTTDVSVFMLDD